LLVHHHQAQGQQTAKKITHSQNLIQSDQADGIIDMYPKITIKKALIVFSMFIIGIRI